MTLSRDGIRARGSITTRHRHLIVCEECRRRKQRCDRQMPCGHCKHRGVPHLCKYEGQRPIESIASDSLDDSLSRSTSKDSMFEISTGQHSRSVTPIEKKSNNKLNLHFTQLGFQSAHRNSAKSHLIDLRISSPNDLPIFQDASLQCNQTRDQLSSFVPAKQYTDTIIQAFLGEHDASQCLVKKPFLAMYEKWWTDRLEGSSSDHVALLILQIIANVLQTAPPEMSGMARQYGQTLEGLSSSFNQIAKEASMICPRCINLVVYYVLYSEFLAAAGSLKDSWIVFGQAVRVAQDLELYRMDDCFGEQSSENVKHRLWVFLCYVDKLLNRPYMISKFTKNSLCTDELRPEFSMIDIQFERINFEIIRELTKIFDELEECTSYREEKEIALISLRFKIEWILKHIEYVRHLLPSVQEVLSGTSNFFEAKGLISKHCQITFAESVVFQTFLDLNYDSNFREWIHSNAIKSSLNLLFLEKARFNLISPMDYQNSAIVLNILQASINLTYLMNQNQSSSFLGQSLQIIEDSCQCLQNMATRFTLASQAYKIEKLLLGKMASIRSETIKACFAPEPTSPTNPRDALDVSNFLNDYSSFVDLPTGQDSILNEPVDNQKWLWSMDFLDEEPTLDYSRLADSLKESVAPEKDISGNEIKI